MLKISLRLVALAGIAVLFAIGLSPIKPVQSEESEPRIELTGVRDNSVLVQIVGDVEILQLHLRSSTAHMSWHCSSQLQKIAADLWSGSLAAPFGPKIDSLEVSLEFEILAAGKKEWIKLKRPLKGFYSLKTSELENDPKTFQLGGSVVEVLLEFQLDKEKSKEWKEVKLWHHWLFGSGPHSGDLVGLGDGRWIFRGRTYAKDKPEEYLELTGWLEIDGVGGDPFKAIPKPVKDLGARVLQVIENQ